MPWSMSTFEKMKVAQNEKRKKLPGFSYLKNIANFEAFWRDTNFSKNLLFLGSELLFVLTTTKSFRLNSPAS